MRFVTLTFLFFLSFTSLQAQSMCDCQTMIMGTSPSNITVTEGQTTSVVITTTFRVINSHYDLMTPSGYYLYNLQWDLGTDKPWASIVTNASGIFPMMTSNTILNHATIFVDPQNLTVPPWMDEVRHSFKITGAIGSNTVYITVKKPSSGVGTGGGSGLDWSISPTYSNFGVFGSVFTRSIQLRNNSSQTVIWNASENSFSTRLSRTSGTLGPNGTTNLYVYGTVSSSGQSIVRITDQTGNSKSATLNWNYYISKRSTQQFEDATFNAAVQEFDYDGDGVLSEMERWSVTELRLNDLGIENLSGIDAFPNLRYLDISGNNLRALPDLRPLENLLILKANDNYFEAVPTDLPAGLKHIELQQQGW